MPGEFLLRELRTKRQAPLNLSALQHIRHADQFGERSRSHLAHRRTAVNLERHLAQAQLSGDLLVHSTRGHQSHYLALARRQGRVAIDDCGCRS